MLQRAFRDKLILKSGEYDAKSISEEIENKALKLTILECVAHLLTVIFIWSPLTVAIGIIANAPTLTIVGFTIIVALGYLVGHMLQDYFGGQYVRKKREIFETLLESDDVVTHLQSSEDVKTQLEKKEEESDD